MSSHTLSSNNWELSYSLHGGRIEALTYKKRSILGSFTRIDGKVGSTHLCVPNFGKEGMESYGLPFHGPARTIVWKEVGERRLATGGRGLATGDWGLATGDRRLEIECVLEKTKTYPAKLRVSQRFELKENEFKHTIVITHQNGDPVPVNLGIHNYWATPLGWQGTKVNGENTTEKIKTNGFVDFKEENEIVFPHMKLILKTNNLNQGVVWTAFNDKKEFDSSYVCIEPVGIYAPDYFGKEISNIGPKMQKTYSQTIHVLDC